MTIANIDKEGLELTKKFRESALCPLDPEHIETGMYWPFYERNAKKGKITIQAVKKYWFEQHNGVVLERLKRKQITTEEAYRCMVGVGEQGKNNFCIHNGMVICNITKEEAEIIEKHTPKLRAQQ